jgi:hypothetical protein
MCKQENQQIIVDRFEDAKLFEEYPLWGDELGDKFTFRDDVGMFFPKEYYESDIASLFGYHCGVCSNYNGVPPDGTGSIRRPTNNNNNHSNTARRTDTCSDTCTGSARSLEIQTSIDSV